MFFYVFAFFDGEYGRAELVHAPIEDISIDNGFRVGIGAGGYVLAGLTVRIDVNLSKLIPEKYKY